MKSQSLHLSEDQIIRAVVDEADVSASERQHLDTCSLCRKEKQKLEDTLNSLGDLSQGMAPVPRKQCVLPVQQSPSLWRRQPVFAIGALAAVLIIGFWWSLSSVNFNEKPSVQTLQSPDGGQQWITQIIAIEEYALPDDYLYLISTVDIEDNEDEYNEYYMDEFTEHLLTWSEV